MIKFFRHIRKDLMNQNKNAKYLKYAIGEIVLVMVGILLALQVNNWNEARIISKQTDALLNNMLTDLKTDIARFNFDAGRMEESIAGGMSLLQAENFETMSADSLFNLLPNNVLFYRISNQTYERFKNISVTKIGDSDALFNNITTYYTFNSNFFETIANWDSKESLEMLSFYMIDDKFEAPMFLTEIFIPYSESETVRKEALLKLISGIKSRNYIRQAITRKSTVLTYLKDIKIQAETLMSSIETELNRK
jgi:hypothetical protein